jgi:23S rRNA pseudouridine2605 synthase
VRVNGQPNDLTFAPLRRGVTIDGEEFQPMEINLDSQQGANAWLTVGIREGRNREIRRAMAHVGLIVNRLIRIGYGPFKLTGMEENEVREVKRKVLRDQLGGLLTGETDEKPRSFRERGAARGEGGDERPRADEAGRKPFARREDGERRPYAKREEGDRKPFVRREDGERPARSGKPGFKTGDRPRSAEGDRGGFAPRDGKPGGFKPRAGGGKPFGEGKPGRDVRGGKPGGKPAGFKPGSKTNRTPGKGARPEGKGPRRG